MVNNEAECVIGFVDLKCTRINSNFILFQVSNLTKLLQFQPRLVLVTAIIHLLLSAGNWIIIFGRIIFAFTIHYYYCMFKLYTKSSKPIKQQVVIIILNIFVLKLIYYYQLIPKQYFYLY